MTGCPLCLVAHLILSAQHFCRVAGICVILRVRMLRPPEPGTCGSFLPTVQPQFFLASISDSAQFFFFFGQPPILLFYCKPDGSLGIGAPHINKKWFLPSKSSGTSQNVLVWDSRPPGRTQFRLPETSRYLRKDSTRRLKACFPNWHHFQLLRECLRDRKTMER